MLEREGGSRIKSGMTALPIESGMTALPIESGMTALPIESGMTALSHGFRLKSGMTA
jgi:hypothetical protein